MAEAVTGMVRQRLAEKLAGSLTAPLPTATPRRVRGTVSLPGKATAVIGMRRAGKTTFLHQLRRERLAAGVARERLPYINFEDEVLAGMEAAQLGFLVDEYYRQYPALRGRETVTWCFDEIQVVPGWERFVRRLLDTEQVEIFVSGSSAALLSREVATSTTRRWSPRRPPSTSSRRSTPNAETSRRCESTCSQTGSLPRKRSRARTPPASRSMWRYGAWNASSVQ